MHMTYKGFSRIIHIALSERKRKIFSSTWNPIMSEVFTVEVESFFKPFQSRLRERKKLHFQKEPQRRPYSIINFPLS